MPDQPYRRIERRAFVLAAAAVLVGVVSGAVALRVARDGALARAVEQREQRVLLLRAHLQVARALVPAVLEEMWGTFPKPNPGSLSVLGRDGRERFRTPATAPSALPPGPDLALEPIHGEAPVHTRALFAREGAWGGWTRAPGGEELLVVGYTDLGRGEVLVMRVPRRELEATVTRQVLPWGLLLVLPGVFTAATLLLLVVWLRRAGAAAREATRAQAEARWRLDLLAANLDEVLYISDPAGGPPRYISPAYERLFGRPVAGIAANSWDFQEAVHPEDRARFAAAPVQPDGSTEVEYRVVLPDGRLRWVRSRWRQALPPEGGMPLFVGVSQDVTMRHEAEEALRQAQKMEAVGQLAGGIAHDFNNLLSVILSMSALVLEELPRDSAMREDVSEVHRAAERAAELTRQLLAFSRRQVARPRLLDLNAVVREAQTLLRRTVRENIHLVVELAEEPLPVYADPGQLEQVLLNLAVNARDAMPQGGALTLQTAALRLDAAGAPGAPGAGDCVQLTVRDTGHGMDAEVQARIFEPFFTTKPPGQGTGLGLASVYGIVTQAGGSVGVESAPGSGSRFSVLLPRAAPLPGEEQVPARRSAPRGHETLLLVEDEQAVRTAIRRVLERAGYAVLEARHGADALLVWRQHRADVALVLTDVMMPELGGTELAARLAAEAPQLPVLFLSGYSDSPLPLSQTPPVRAFLNKPPIPEALLTEVRRLLDVPPRLHGATGD